MKIIMEKINSTQLMEAYEAARVLSHEDVSSIDSFQPVEKTFEDKKSSPDASIMIYGVYNAGKSTLINVLLGREEAAVKDIPETDQVTAYRWGPYNILDTPGVDAPIAHEKVTQEQMLKADAVIFVVDPVGTAEEFKTLSVLIDLLQAGKQVFLVFNEKKSISEEDFIRLKDQTRERLQQMAVERRLDAVLKDIPIIKINAKRALQGRIQGPSRIIELSGYPVFEKQLNKFLQSISSDEIYGRLKILLIKFLNNYIAELNSRSQSGIVKKYDKILRGISIEKAKLHQKMDLELSHNKNNIYEKSKLIIRTSPENCQLQIEKLLESSGKNLSASLNSELQFFVNNVQDEIEELQTALPSLTTGGMPVTVPTLETARQQLTPQDRESQASKVDPTLVKGAVDQIAALAKPEHIVESLKLVKSTLPSLMKGIGPKTMEKWASTVLTKCIPHVGTLISVATILFDMLSGDSEEKQLRQQSEEQKMARERALQQIDDFANEISEGFETSMRGIVQIELDTFFAGVVKQVDTLRQGFSEADRSNSQRLEKIIEVQQLATAA